MTSSFLPPRVKILPISRNRTNTYPPSIINDPPQQSPCLNEHIVLSPYIDNSEQLPEVTHVKNKSIKSIRPDLDKYSLPDDIKNEANNIYLNLNINTKRGNQRKLLIFFCVFMAYKKLKEPKIPKLVAEIIGISPDDITKAFSMCSFRLQDSRINEPIDPLQFIKGYLSLINIDESCLDNIINFGKEIIDKSKDLLQEHPHVIAAGILFYYLRINGVQIHHNDFAKAVRLSDMTISKLYKRIGNIHNT